MHPDDALLRRKIMEMKDIDFEKGFENKEEGAKVVKQIQDAYDESVAAFLEAEALAKKMSGIAEGFKEQAELFQINYLDATQGIKAIHLILNTKRELFKGDKEMDELMNMLATFVVSPAAIKVGILANAIGKENGTK